MDSTREQDAPVAGPLHMYEVYEGGTFRHWCVAHDEEEAVGLVLDMEPDDPEGLEAEEVEDDRPWPVTFVDGWDNPERPQDEYPACATVEYIRDGVPQVTTTAGEWARWQGCPAYIGGSE